MSEYQYYEFLAVDRPLTPGQIKQVREYSDRAEISATSFINEYNYGDFRGNPDTFLDKYFDVMLYYANWGTHTLKFSLPLEVYSKEKLREYLVSDCSSFVVKASKAIVDLTAGNDGGEYDEQYDASLAAMAPVREELLRGDLRPLYLAWLLGVSTFELEDSEVEPPVPPGLGALTPAQTALAEFLRIEEDLIAVAAENSAALAAGPQEDLKAIVAALPPARRDELLREFLEGDKPHLAVQVRREFAAKASAADSQKPRRTVEMLRSASEAAEEKRKEIERQKRAADKERKEKEARKRRKIELDELAERGEAAWVAIEQLVLERLPKSYERAANLVRDLYELSRRDGKEAWFAEHIAAVRERHGAKRSFMDRLKGMKV